MLVLTGSSQTERVLSEKIFKEYADAFDINAINSVVLQELDLNNSAEFDEFCDVITCNLYGNRLRMKSAIRRLQEEALGAHTEYVTSFIGEHFYLIMSNHDLNSGV